MGNDPSGLCVYGSACELRCQLLMMTDGGSAFMVRGPKTAWCAHCIENHFKESKSRVLLWYVILTAMWWIGKIQMQ